VTVSFRIARLSGLFAVAALAASALAVGIPARALADTPPPASFSVALSPDNVVPAGTGQPGTDDPTAAVYVTGSTGEVCWYANLMVVPDLTSAGIYQGVPNSIGSLVLDLPFSGLSGMCAEQVDQATIDAITGNPGDYYMQLDTASFPFGASRGQLVFVPPTIGFDVNTWICPHGTNFKSAKSIANCGGVALPGQGFAPNLGMSSTNFAGEFAFDYRITGPAGFNQTISPELIAGAGGICDPSTLTCQYGALSYEWTPQPGLITVQPLVAPAGAKLAHVSVTVLNETNITWKQGPHGLVSVDLTNAYYALTFVNYYYVAPGKVTPPTEIQPVVALGTGSPTANGAEPLSLQYGAVERGNGPIHYEVQAQRDGGSFQPVVKTTSPVATVNEKPGHTYVFRVRATDNSGAASAWVSSDPFSL
jgi:hypothetical protein